MRARVVIVVLAAVAVLLGGCTTPPAPAPPTTVTEFPSTSATTSPSVPVTLPGAATTEVKVDRNLYGALTAVRVGRQDGYDRVVFEFAKDVPGYRVAYLDLPVRADPSGNLVSLPDATSAVGITFNPASAVDWGAPAPVPSYTGPNEVSVGNTVQVTKAIGIGDFERVLTWAVGLRQKVPFVVTRLDGPPRLVVDFQHVPNP